MWRVREENQISSNSLGGEPIKEPLSNQAVNPTPDIPTSHQKHGHGSRNVFPPARPSRAPAAGRQHGDHREHHEHRCLLGCHGCDLGGCSGCCGGGFDDLERDHVGGRAILPLSARRRRDRDDGARSRTPVHARGNGRVRRSHVRPCASPRVARDERREGSSSGHRAGGPLLLRRANRFKASELDVHGGSCLVLRVEIGNGCQH